jgi:K+-sensing histidine kinase KdpD
MQGDLKDEAETSDPLYDQYKTLMHFVYAILTSVAALCLIQILQPLLRGNHVYWVLWPVVIIAARLWGPVAAALAALVGWLGVWYWFIPPSDSFAIENRSDLIGLIGFVVVATLIILSNLREYELKQRVAATARTANVTMQMLLAAYFDACCNCKNESDKGRKHGHDLNCLAHSSVPVVVRAERSIRMLSALAEDGGATARHGAPKRGSVADKRASEQV